MNSAQRFAIHDDLPAGFAERLGRPRLRRHLKREHIQSLEGVISVASDGNRPLVKPSARLFT